MNQARTSLGQIEHPVHGLIRNATKKWEALLQKQSKTLAEAVAEYKRRYGRNPPKGFDKWYLGICRLHTCDLYLTSAIRRQV